MNVSHLNLNCYLLGNNYKVGVIIVMFCFQGVYFDSDKSAPNLGHLGLFPQRSVIIYKDES